MEKVVGIRFEPCGRIYGFKSDGLGLKAGELVVVESDLGVSLGKVVAEDFETKGQDVKPVLRRASGDDLRQEDENEGLKLEALNFCMERIKARGLPMKLTGTNVTLDRKRIMFYFVADGRVDFRELVKDLAARFRTRIELRQIGVRDAARLSGDVGVCGRELCCRRFLTAFEPISIKMAKQQDLALNACKLSGLCGRLMCCLSYECDRSTKRGDHPAREEEKTDTVSGAPPCEEKLRKAVEECAPERLQQPQAVSSEADAQQSAQPQAVSSGQPTGKTSQPGDGHGHRKRRWRRHHKKR